MVHYLGERALFLPLWLIFGDFFLQMHQKMLYNICYWWFSLSQGNQWTKYLAHPKIRRPKTCLLMFVSLVAEDSFHLLLYPQLTADLTLEWSGGSNVSSIVTYLHKNSFLFCWNSCNQVSESSMHCCFWLTVSKHNIHFEPSFFVD